MVAIARHKNRRTYHGAVNPGSLLGTKMVKQGFGTDGKDIGTGAGILCRAALDDDFTRTSGQYYDNDIAQFSAPHPGALDAKKVSTAVAVTASVNPPVYAAELTKAT